MSTLEPLDPELAALFERELATHRAEPMARDEVLARVERAIRLSALAPDPVAARPGAPLADPSGLLGGAGAKVLVTVAVAAAFGGGVVVGRSRVSTPIATPSVSVIQATSARPPTTVVDAGTPSIEASSLPAAPRLLNRSDSSAGPRASDGSGDLAKEQELVDTARGALARGRGAEAFAATQQHARRYPNGALSEERDALEVQAMALDGRSEEARVRAERFVIKYPQSIFRTAVQRAAQP